jgi:hypothetical protein
MRAGTVMKETLGYFEEELIGVVERLRFVANNMDDRSKHDDCCQQVEVAINKLKDLIRETDIKGESK